MPSCRMLPHGVYSLVPAVLTTMAWMASLFQDGCDYARLSGDLVDQIAVAPGTPFLEVGFAAYREPLYVSETNTWEVVYTGKCLAYPGDIVDQDGKWTISKGFAFLALVLGGGGTFFLWFSTCCVFSRGTWRWAGYEVLLAALFQMLAFLWFRNDMCQSEGSACTLFWGSKADIVATVFWTLSACLIFCKYPTPKDIEGDGILVREGEITSPTVNLRDGNGGEGMAVTTASPEDTITMSSGEDPQQGADTPEGEPKKELTDVEIL